MSPKDHGFDDDDGVDILDLRGMGVSTITYDEGRTDSGTVTFKDGSQVAFCDVEKVIPCFTPGTLIATTSGERSVESLKVGDKVITRDNGIQEIAWIGSKTIGGKDLVHAPHLRPILIKAGALGNGLPEKDMLLSPNHRVHVASDLTQLYFEEREVLAAAKHLVGAEGVFKIDVMQTTYIHFMCEHHEVVCLTVLGPKAFSRAIIRSRGLATAKGTNFSSFSQNLRPALARGTMPPLGVP